MGSRGEGRAESSDEPDGNGKIDVDADPEADRDDSAESSNEPQAAAVDAARDAGSGETKADKGTKMIPARLADEYPPDVFVRESGVNGAPVARSKYTKGEFVVRLSGRDRQRSASYYTREVLTRCVVKHSLAELLTDDMPAARVLDLTSASRRSVPARS